MLAPSFQTTCNGGSVPGLLEWYYTRDYDFSGVNCTRYVIQWGECCRNGSSTNLVNAGSQSAGMTTDTLNLALAPCNSSPEWRQIPPPHVFLGQPSSFDAGAHDPDGDSLVYSLVSARDQSLANVAYNAGYSPTNPLGPSWSVSLNPQSGILHITSTPGNFQYATIVEKVAEYRNGQQIGSVTREFMIFASNLNVSCPNALPSISGPYNVQGGRFISNEIVVAPGGTVCMDFMASDPDLGNATRLTWLRDLPGATLSDTFGTPMDTVFAVDPWARLCWTAPNALGMETVTITALDTTCQLNNMVVATFTIRVGDTSLVWPGDTDNDLVANVFDLLPIGIAYGDVGNARTSPTLAWVGQECLPWLDTIIGGTDKMFIDCNGNGTVEATDAAAIVLNYGLTHTKAHLPAARGTTTDPPLRLILPDSADVGDTIVAPILLGDSVTMASNILGYAFQLHYDSDLIDSSTFWIDFSNSWVGNGGNPLELYENLHQTADCDAGQVRTTHTTVSGMGEVCRAHFVIIDNIDGKRQALDSAMLDIFFTDVRVISLNGEVVPVDPQMASMIVYDRTTETQASPTATGIHVYPNPAHHRLYIEAEGQDLHLLELLTVQGQVLLHHQHLGGSRHSMDISQLAHGLYFLRVKTQGGTTVKRVLVE